MRVVYKNRTDTDIAVTMLNRVWRDVASSRAIGTTYTNTKTYPIELSISVDHPNGTAGRQARLLVGGVIVAETFVQSTTNATRNIVPITATVPPGATYLLSAISGSPGIFRWAELS